MTSPELFMNVALLKALLDTGQYEKAREVLNEVYVKLGGNEKNDNNQDEK